jgi:hypothetical protein
MDEDKCLEVYTAILCSLAQAYHDWKTLQANTPKPRAEPASNGELGVAHEQDTPPYMAGTPEDLNLSTVRDHINVCFPNDCKDFSMPQVNDQMDLNSEDPSVTSEVSQITNR